MRFLVIGCGSIGQRHIKNLKKLGCEIYGCEKDLTKAKHVEKIHKIKVFRSLKEALRDNYNGALICTSTSLHVFQAIEVAKKGIDIFIEKPLSHSLNNVDRLSKIVKNKHLVSLVGCNLRFSESLKTIKGLIEKNKIGKILSVRIECGYYLPYWHPYEDYRKGYSANRSLGGGVILDDIHEIDSLIWLFGKVKEASCLAEKISSLGIDTEDIAEISLRFKTGIIAQIHLDYLRRSYRRSYEFIGEKGIIFWDVIRNKIELDYGKNKTGLVLTRQKKKREQMFIDELRYFIDCIKEKKQTINDIESAKIILKVALACHRSAKIKRTICI